MASLLRPCAPGANLHTSAHLKTTCPYPYPSLLFFPSLHPHRKPYSSPFLLRAKAKSEERKNPNESNEKVEIVEEVEEEVEEDLPWIQEKAMDLVEFTGTVTQAIPGPRVGQSSLPWILAVPLTYVGLSFVVAVVKTVKKLNSPREKKRKLVRDRGFSLLGFGLLFLGSFHFDLKLGF